MSDANALTRCICCGCTELQACLGGPQGRCWWTHIDAQGDGLCSQCAAVPFDDLVHRIFNVHVSQLWMNQAANRIVATRAELPVEYACTRCGAVKPIAEMVLIHRRRTKDFLLRPRCKKCHNTRERGHRRKWKTAYLRNWREYNSELNESYWRKANAQNRAKYAARAYARFQRSHSSLLIQGRLRRRGIKVSIAEARGLFKKFGRCYPQRCGLTPKGLRECERIRSAFRTRGKTPPRPIEIRMMVYDDGLFIKPSRQPVPYQIVPVVPEQSEEQTPSGPRLHLPS